MENSNKNQNNMDIEEDNQNIFNNNQQNNPNQQNMNNLNFAIDPKLLQIIDEKRKKNTNIKTKHFFYQKNTE